MLCMACSVAACLNQHIESEISTFSNEKYSKFQLSWNAQLSLSIASSSVCMQRACVSESVSVLCLFLSRISLYISMLIMWYYLSFCVFVYVSVCVQNKLVNQYGFGNSYRVIWVCVCARLEIKIQLQDHISGNEISNWIHEIVCVPYHVAFIFRRTHASKRLYSYALCLVCVLFVYTFLFHIIE